MIEILKKYYKIDIKDYQKYKDGIIFQIDGINYLFTKCYFNKEYIDNLYQICNNFKQLKLHDFVFNKDKQLISEEYILFKINVLIDNITLEDIIKFNSIDCNMYKNNYISMQTFWENKIDYLEIQISELSDNPLINKSFDYYIGIAEILIQYLKKHPLNIDLCLSHKGLHSINSLEFYNPLYLSFDLKYKDLATYIRQTNDYNLLFKIIDNRVDDTNYNYFFVRMIFPFDYFDIISDMVIDLEEEKILVNMLNNIEEYEKYIGEIQDIFGIYLFPWLKKSN